MIYLHLKPTTVYLVLRRQSFYVFYYFLKCLKVSQTYHVNQSAALLDFPPQNYYKSLHVCESIAN